MIAVAEIQSDKREKIVCNLSLRFNCIFWWQTRYCVNIQSVTAFPNDLTLDKKQSIMGLNNYLPTLAPLALAALLVLPLMAAFAATISGTPDNNVIKGTPYRDTIYGYGSSDKLYGGIGDDDLYGGSGNDYMHDMSGYDTDNLYGGSGADIIKCKGYQCNVHGDSGNDL